MTKAMTRVGILKPFSSMTKQVKLYTRPNNYEDEYPITLIAYLYDQDGAIAERVEKKVIVECVAEAKPSGDAVRDVAKDIQK